MTTKRVLRALSIFVLGFLLLSYVNAARAEHRGHQAKHIILMIGDGMNIEHEIATSRYLYGKDFELSFHKLPSRLMWPPGT